jgi:hypothetical protein
MTLTFFAHAQVFEDFGDRNDLLSCSSCQTRTLLPQQESPVRIGTLVDVADLATRERSRGSALDRVAHLGTLLKTGTGAKPIYRRTAAYRVLESQPSLLKGREALDQQRHASAGHLTLRRREVTAALVGAATLWPVGTYAQQQAMPVIGFVHLNSLELTREYVAAFHRGLADAGFIDGKNLHIEYRWGEGRNDRLPILIGELVSRPVSVLVVLESTLGSIPIVFLTVTDPLGQGLVSSLAHPGGNVTGFSVFESSLGAKWLQLLTEIAPGLRND